MMFNQHVDMPNLLGESAGKGEVLTNTDLNKFVLKFLEKYVSSVHQKTKKDFFWIQQKQKCCANIFVKQSS